MNKKTKHPSGTRDENQEFPGYQSYPAGDDIYKQFKEESEIDPEDPSKTKISDKTKGSNEEKELEQDIVTGEDLDVPGAELDDEAEAIGSEDEENNYYSLGGDNHEDLEEDRG